MFHRYAIAVVSANLPSAGDPSVMETVAMPRPWLPDQIRLSTACVIRAG